MLVSCADASCTMTASSLGTRTSGLFCAAKSIAASDSAPPNSADERAPPHPRKRRPVTKKVVRMRCDLGSSSTASKWYPFRGDVERLTGSVRFESHEEHQQLRRFGQAHRTIGSGAHRGERRAAQDAVERALAVAVG